jgi:hypothetical protein
MSWRVPWNIKGERAIAEVVVGFEASELERDIENDIF